MRPTARFLILALGVFVISVLILIVSRAEAGMALFPWAVLICAVLVDAVLAARHGRIEIAAQAPYEVFSGESGVLSLTGRGRGGVTPKNLSARLTPPEGLDIASVTHFEGSRAEVPFEAQRRGIWRIDQLWLSWPGPLGLVEMIRVAAASIEISVIPNIRAARSGEIEIAVRSTLFGSKANLLRGEGSEFHQLRDFAQGMDPRLIDWKHSARHRRLLGRETRAERNHQVILALDNGHLMRQETEGMPKIDHQITAALGIGWAAVLGGDRVGMFAFDARPRLFLPPDSGREAFARLRSATAGLDYQSVETNHTLALSHLHQRLKRRSLVVVFSDFVDTTTAELLIENLAIITRHHVVIFVTLNDPAMQAIEQDRPETLNGVARAVVADQILKERRAVLARLARLGILCLAADPKALTAQLVSLYLNIKARELI